MTLGGWKAESNMELPVVLQHGPLGSNLKGYPLHYKKVTSQIDHIRDMLSIFYFIEKTSSRVDIFNFLVFLAPHDFLTLWCQAWP